VRARFWSRRCSRSGVARSYDSSGQRVRILRPMISVASQRPLTFVRSAPSFAGLLVIALIAFWPTYLSQVTSAGAFTHFHALTATIWILLLIAQPVAIRARRLPLHRTLGRMSYGVAPLVVLGMVLVAHRNTTRPGIPELDRVGVYVPLMFWAFPKLTWPYQWLTLR